MRSLILKGRSIEVLLQLIVVDTKYPGITIKELLNTIGGETD